jgi:hypothetical protein
MEEVWFGYISHLHGKCIFQSLVRTSPGILPASAEERCRPLYLCVQYRYKSLNGSLLNVHLVKGAADFSGNPDLLTKGAALHW